MRYRVKLTFFSSFFFYMRAGGHLRPDIYSATALFTERYGFEAAAEVVRFEISHLKLLEELVRKENIDCELTFAPSYDMYLDEDQLKKAKAFYDSLVDQGFDFMDDVKYMTQSDTQEVCPSRLCGDFTVRC
jgi:hypothetical protein